MKKYLNLLYLSVIFPAVVFGANTFVENSNDDLTTFLTRIKDFLIGIAGSAAVLFIIIGGIMYITSSGDPKKIDQAKKTLTYAIFGLILVLISNVVLGILSGENFLSSFK